ncbi:hypothetical protein FNV43_RR16682 [Rhamnella rubrinervis]|uniref:MD-2-related lipid-recognition domain-containing protein n=1 Tax=Rhamnella rubrinervis TaxID=2594499 RepID=A0A8K0GZA3_9ROSA|nr:hypothetical protein FNV43_RR16682 [Rhamnella rubrinervis]
MEMAQLKFMVPLLLVLLCLIVPQIQAHDVHYCDKKVDYDVKVKAVDISPYPVARGKPAKFSISATTGEAITEGKMMIEVSYFGWHIYSESQDLCVETSCPISTGDFVVSHSQVLPGFTPPGSYSLKMKMYNGSNSELTCITFDFYIGFASSVADS